MREEAEETARRGTEVADPRRQEDRDPRKGTRDQGEAYGHDGTYLGDDADGLDGFEFLTMAEAGEVGHWAVLGKLNEPAGEEEISTWSNGRCRSRNDTSPTPRTAR